LKALILAAGLGSRLMPLTSDTPKALINVNGITLLERAIRKAAKAGFDDIIVNVHHFAGQIIDFLNASHFEGVKLAISDESDILLDTGGAIRKARWFLDGHEPFLVHNVDIISNIDLASMLSYHVDQQNLATLSVMDRKTSRYFLFDKAFRLKGWKDIYNGKLRWVDGPKKDLTALAFSGIHLLNPEIFDLLKESGRFSIVDAYLRLALQHQIHAYLQQDFTWFDIGKPDQLEKASEYLATHPERNDLL